MGEWFERSFGADYMVVYKHRDWDNAAREVRNMIGLLNLPAGAEVLDVGCGMGRHAVALSGMGYRVTGIDLSEALLEEARRRDDGGTVEWKRGDMRRLPVEDGRYAATVNFFTSFGYFDADDENASVLRELRRVLRPDGKFLIDFLNPSYVVRHLVPHSERVDEDTGWTISEHRRIEAGTVIKDIRITASGEPERNYQERVKLYPLAWFREQLAAAGLRLGDVYGDYDGSPYTDNVSKRMVMTGTVQA